MESLLPPVERAATGEIPIAITLVHYTYVFGQTGAPLDYVRLSKILGGGNYIALNNKTPHPTRENCSSTISWVTKALKSWPN
jgi:hypothetical protein